MFSFVLIIASLYIILIIFACILWVHIPTPVTETYTPATLVTIIIAARNEEKYIQKCLYAILTQNYPQELLEVIVVDDFSTDDTAVLIKKFNHQSLKLIRLKDHFKEDQLIASKKQAIALAIEKSRGELIITTDADCLVKKNWVRTIADLYEKNQARMIIGPVNILPSISLLGVLQSLDMIVMTAFSGVFAHFKKPILCNGANLAYSKKDFLAVNGFETTWNSSSGDDVHLMDKFYQYDAKGMYYLKSYEATVNTFPVASWKAFWQQRIRWGGKTKHSSNIFTKIIAAIVLVGNVALLYAFVFAFLNVNHSIHYLYLFIITLLADFLFLCITALFFKQNKLLWLFLPVRLVYIIYIITIGIGSNFGSYVWKGRK